MMHWTIFHPGPSLKKWKAINYDSNRSIAVNGAILLFRDVAYWAMLNYEVFVLCSRQLINGNGVEKGQVACILAVKRALLALPKAVAPVLIGMEAREIQVYSRDKVKEIIE